MFICAHDHSALARPAMASSPFVVSFHLPGRQYQRRFGLRPQLWPVSPYQLHDWTAPFANPDSQQHEPSRMGSYQMTHYNQTKTVVSEASKVEGLTSGWRGMLTVYVIQTTADAMSKHDIARRQNGPVKKLMLLLVDRRYKENRTRTCTSKTLHMMILTR